MTGVVFRIHTASLIHLAFLLHSLSITFAPSQSMMQLFLSAWYVIAEGKKQSKEGKEHRKILHVKGVTELIQQIFACQDNWRAEEEFAVPEFLMKAANGSRNVE